jgi:hypothetical protein
VPVTGPSRMQKGPRRKEVRTEGKRRGIEDEGRHIHASNFSSFTEDVGKESRAAHSSTIHRASTKHAFERVASIFELRHARTNRNQCAQKDQHHPVWFTVQHGKS